MNQPELILVCGIQGSGKSTWARQHVQDNIGVVYLSSDDIRKELTGNMADQSVNGLVFNRMRQRAEAALLKGESVLIDATNIKKKSRKDFVDLGKRVGAKLVAHVFKVDRETAIKRVSERASGGGLNVPIDVIDRFIAQYQAPDRSEFDQIINH